MQLAVHVIFRYR